jgi:hypothetical protein
LGILTLWAFRVRVGILHDADGAKDGVRGEKRVIKVTVAWLFQDNCLSLRFKQEIILNDPH